MITPKMHVPEGFPVLPQSVMTGFSDKSLTDEAARLIGLPPETTEEVADEGSESSG